MAASRSRRRPICGLIIKQTEKAIPLKEVSIEAEIRACLLGLKSVLKYNNDTSDPAEVLFRFPVEDSSAVVKLTAIIDGRSIKADIKEKEEARAAYDDAIASGQSAVLGEEKTGDVFSIVLGNLPPGKDAEIHLQVVAELPIDAEENVRFSLPSVFKPRYAPAGSSDPFAPLSDSASQVSSAQIAGYSRFQLNISAPQTVSSITSPTHTLNCANVADKIQVTLSDQKPADKDLVVLIKHNAPHQPSAVVEEGRETGFMSQAAVMVNFFPKFETEQSECEFIFLVDRSGSMSGQFIQSASETLILFMKSLPENCYFNIIGFGSRYEQLFSEGSVPYSQPNLDKAVAHLTGLQANLGGTELHTPLDFIFRSPPASGFSRQVFVLTDGAVGNTDACVQKVKQNNKTSRCFTFGIGSGASTALVEGLARAGNGSAEFVKEGERLQPKVIRSLKRALQPALTDVSLEFKISGKADVVQCPQNLPPIFAGEKLVVYALVKTKTKKTNFTGKAVIKGKLLRSTISEIISFESGGAEEELSTIPIVHHLAAKALIKDWERENKSAEDVTKLSIESNVICSHTAFIAVDEENSKPIEGALQTFDVHPVSSMPMLFGGGGIGSRGSSMLAMGMPARKMKKKSGGVKSARAIPVARARRSPGAMGGPPPPPGAMGGPPPPPGAMGGPPPPPGAMGGPPPPPPPGAMGGPPPPPRAMGGPPPAPPMVSSLAEKSSLEVVDLSSIIGAQQADGSWKMNAALAQFVGKTVEEIKSSCPIDCQGVMALLWATLLMLELLNTQYEDDREEWELVGAKAQTWTKRQSLPAGDTTLDNMKEAAKKLFA